MELHLINLSDLASLTAEVGAQKMPEEVRRRKKLRFGHSYLLFAPMGSMRHGTAVPVHALFTHVTPHTRAGSRV